MANIVFLTLDGGGNVPPALAIAGELIRRGHRVRFLAGEQQVPQLRDAGFDATAYRHAKGWSPTERMSAARGLSSFAALLGDRGYAQDLDDALTAEPADVAVLDALMPRSVASAVSLGIPVVTLMHSFAGFFLRNPAMTALGLSQGVHPDRAWATSAAILVAADRELDPRSRRKVPANLVWTGVAELPPAGPADLSGSVPQVLASLSTVAAPGQDRVLQNVLDALAPMPVEAIVTTGPTIEPERMRAGGNTRLLRQASHAEILPGCAAVVGHGGHSTTMRALLHGVPMVIVPCDTRIDQPMIGAAVQRAGAGIRLPKKASPERIREALSTVLADPGYREAALRIGERLRNQNGVARAADEVLAVAMRSARV